MNNIKTDEEINKLKMYLQNLEDTDPAYMNSDMKELNHFVTFTHMRMEESLGHLLIRNQLQSLNGMPMPIESYRTPFATGTSIAIEVDFYRKVELATENTLINTNVQNRMHKVNNLRKWFSHPSKYYGKLDELKTDRAVYKKALDNLVKAHDEMNDIFRALPSNPNSDTP